MVLILCNAHYEHTTDYVIDWLDTYGVDYVRINCEDITQQQKINQFDLTDDHFWVKGRRVEYAEVRVVWYRRWYHYAHLNFRAANANERQLYWETMKESDSLLRYLYFCFRHCHWLTKPIVNLYHEKLYAIRAAAKFGLKVPRSLVTNKKADLQSFLEEVGGEVITKPIANPSIFITDKGQTIHKSYTEVITPDFLRQLPSSFYVSLFQEKADAAFEIRTFYLDGKLYPTAILHSATVDIKLSVRVNADICMAAYSLPPEIEEKLRQLMDHLDLNTGSIDIIKTKQGDYVFIEVNPIGQFTGYGNAANYPLAMEVAKWLAQHDKIDHHATAKEYHIRPENAAASTGLLPQNA